MMFLTGLIAGYLATLGKKSVFLALAIAILALILFIPQAKPQYFVNRGNAFYLTNQATTTSSSELMPLWVKQLPIQSWKDKVEITSGTVQNLSYNSRGITFNLNLPKDEIIRINTIYYSGWKISVDGINTKINYNNQFGVIDLQVNAGQHFVKGEFKETPLRLLSDLISFFSILGLIVYLSFRFILKFKKI
jgi:hypothetical protein